MKKVFMYIGTAGLLFACSPKEKADGTTGDFKYLVDEFADLKVMRYQIPEWDSLSLQQKEYIYCLGEAAKYGRDIIWDQHFKYNLAIRKTIENILTTYTGDKNAPEYKNFEVYAKRAFFSNGIHHHYAEDKFTPEITEEYFAELVRNSNAENLPLKEGESVEEFLAFITPIMFDQEMYATRRNSGQGIDIVATSAVNFYEGVSQKEAEDFYAQMQDPTDETPISYGLNSKLVKKDGKVCEDVYRSDDGLYGKAIDQIIYWLEKANAVAENDAQRNYTNLLIEYYKTGNLEVWDAYNVAWVEDTESTIDYVNGFIEDYSDPLGRKASWEAVVNFRDFEASKRSKTISDNAQWFEDNSPVDDKFKKKEVKGVSAKGIIATTLAGDCFPAPPIGINLPNADWIRKNHGSKSVTITNLMEAYDKAAEESPKSMLSEFAYDQAEIDICKKYGSHTSVVHTDLHECLGHGSGQLLPGTPSGALKEYNSALEEARADLFGLYYCADPKMVELGIMPDGEAYKAEYISFIRNGLMGQLARVELGKTITESHMQDRKLISEWCYEQGKAENVIEKKIKDGKTYFVINDFEKLRNLFGRLLAEIQRIKSEGDYEAGKAMVEKYAVQVDPELHKEVKERYAALGIKPYGGFINPEIVPVVENGKTVDYRIEYPTDFRQQHLDSGKKYATLEATR